MSRWRETLMAYGNMFGDAPGARTSHSSSINNYSTLDRALRDKKNDEAELKMNLEIHFRPLFQRYVYGGEKIACHDLRRILRDPEYRQRIPIDKVHELADLADFNTGRSMTYDEFVRIVLNKPTDDDDSIASEEFQDPVKMSTFSSFLTIICRNTEPQNLVDQRVKKYKCFPPPFFMILISLAEVIAFIYYAIDQEAAKPLQGVEPYNALMYMPTRRRECWRFFSYILLHQGYVDLIVNIAIQIVLGIPLEIMFSWWRISIVYFLGVLAGSLGQSLSDHDVGLVGAAGGAYAILGAHLLSLFQNWNLMNDNLTESRTQRCVCSVTLRMILMIAVAIFGLALAVVRRWELVGFSLDTGELRIGIAAHVGGLLAGFFLNQAFLKDHRRYPWQEGAGWMNLFTILIFVGISIIFNIAYNGYPDEDRTSLSAFLDQDNTAATSAA